VQRYNNNGSLQTNFSFGLSKKIESFILRVVTGSLILQAYREMPPAISALKQKDYA